MLKNLKVSPFRFFRHYETVQSSHFSSDRFSQYISTNIFFRYSPIFWRTIRSKALYPNFWRYVQTILRFSKEETEVRKQALLFAPARYIRISEAFSEPQMHSLGVSKLCVFRRRHPGRILKTLRFLVSAFRRKTQTIVVTFLFLRPTKWQIS